MSDKPSPDVVPVLGSVRNAPEVSALPDAEAGLTACPPADVPEDNQLVLWGDAPKPGIAAELPSCCCCLVRMNPLLPVTEACGGSRSIIPFSFINSEVLLPVAEPCAGLLCLVSSHSMPLSVASAAGEEARLAATSLSPSVDQENQRHDYNDNVNSPKK